MKPKTMILMVVAVGCGLGASYMTSRLLAEREAKKEPEPTVPVLMAKTRVPGWQPIKQPERYFEVKQVPVSLGLRKPIGTLDEIKDQRLNKPIEEGKPVLADDLASKDQLGMDNQLQPGQRAVSIKVSPDSMVSGFVMPGNRVDVVWTVRGQEASAKTILQNMLVLAIDSEDTRSSDKKTLLGQNVTLAATTEEAGRLALAGATGELRLLLRGHGDTKMNNHVSVKLSDLDRPPSHTQNGEATTSEPLIAAPTTPPIASNPLPVLTEDKAPEEPAPVVVEKPRKVHVMTIYNGSESQKARFTPKNENDEDGEGGISAPPPSKPNKPNKPNKVGAKK